MIELPAGLDGALRLALRDTASCWSDDSDAADTPADIAALLVTTSVAVDELVGESCEASAAVQLGLRELELANRLLRQAGGQVSLAD